MLRDSEGVSLWERWKQHYQGKGYRSEANLARTNILAAVFFVGNAVSMLYCMVFYAVPFYFKDYGVQTLYWLKVVVCFVHINGVANWLSARFYTSVLRETRDRPHLSKTLWDAVEDGGGGASRNGHAAEPWHDRCEVCRIARPALTHHCRDCNKCVLRRDHHCYLLGRCVGNYNQRYFIVLSLYVGVASSLAQLCYVHYLRTNAADPDDGSWLAGPHTLVWRLLSGQMPLHVALMMFQCYYLWALGIVGAGYFCLQMEIVRRGVTQHQFRKGIPPARRRSTSDNFKEVFGDFWALNFLFPAQLLFRLKPPA